MAPKLPTSWAQLPLGFLPPDALLPLIAKRSIKYGWTTAPARGKPARFNQQTAGLPTLEHSPAAALKRKDFTLPLRTGALAVKKGMTALYDPDTGVRTPCTVVQLDRVQVVSHKTRERHGYYAVQMGAGWRRSKVTRPVLGHFTGAGVSPKRFVTEFRVKDERGLLKVGESVGPEWFLEGQFVDTRSDCKGKGWAGGMKRWGFKGQPASHGNSKTHRAMGSSGASQGSGSRVLPGKKMPGRMGGNQVTIQNVKVLKVHAEKGILVLNGCIAGPNGCIVKIQDSVKKPWPVIPAAVEQVKETVPVTA